MHTKTIVVTLLFTLSAFGAPQRFRFIGSSADGKRAAILTSHFGPSSMAPFANVFVKEEGKAEPIFHENRFSFEGGEEEMKEVEEAVLEASAAKLKELGITSVLPVEAPPGPHFMFKEAVEKECRHWVTCIGQNRCLAVKSAEDCSTKSVKLRYIYKSGDTYWFVAFRTISAIAPLEAEIVDFAGLSGL